jgi:hypothetical protein
MRIGLFALAVIVGGCHYSLTDTGTDPKSAQLYYPTGLVMDPAGRYLYVANANADLKYGGGTVVMADMVKFECTVARYRRLKPASGFPAPAWPDLCGDEASYDAIVQGALCRDDPLDPSIVDCDESAFILYRSTVRIGNFAGEMRLQRDPNDPFRRRLYIGVRGDPSITWVDVRLPGSTLENDPQNPDYVPATPDSPGLLQCVTNRPSLATTSSDIFAGPRACDIDHLVQQFYCSGFPDCSLGVNNAGPTELPPEPFGMVLDGAAPRLLVTSLASGQVSVITTTGVPSLVYTSTAFFMQDYTGHAGAFGMAQQHPDDPNSNWYVTSNLNPQIATFRVADANVIVPGSTLVLSATFLAGNDVRALAFDQNGNRALITDNNPPSVLTFDTRPVAVEGGQPNNTVTGAVDVCLTPSQMGMYRIALPGAPGAPTQLKTKLVVTCFASNEIMIVDPDRPGVDDTIFNGLGGPNDITFNYDYGPDGKVPPDNMLVNFPHRAYVTNFNDSTVAVVDLQPGTPTENRVIAQLGFPFGGFQP